MINYEAALKKIVGYTKTAYLRDLGVHLYKVRRKWEHYMRTLEKKKRRNITMAVNISNWSELAKRFLVNKVSWAVKGGGGESWC